MFQKQTWCQLTLLLGLCLSMVVYADTCPNTSHQMEKANVSFCSTTTKGVEEKAFNLLVRTASIDCPPCKGSCDKPKERCTFKNIELGTGISWDLKIGKNDPTCPNQGESRFTFSFKNIRTVTCLCECSALLVELSGFTAIPTKNGVALNWDTGAEPDSQAFHIWRGTPDLGSYCGCSRNLEDYKKISMLDKKGKPILIPTTGDERMGAEYSHLDKEAKPGIAYCYILEDIDSKGESEFYFEYIVFTSE